MKEAPPFGHQLPDRRGQWPSFVSAILAKSATRNKHVSAAATGASDQRRGDRLPLWRDDPHPGRFDRLADAADYPDNSGQAE